MGKGKKGALIGVVAAVLVVVLGLLGLRKAGVFGVSKGEVRKDLTSVEVVKLMGNGINLGNTMEAYGHLDLGTDADVSAYETYWGQPETTQEMITAMKEAGFDSLRIPVAWTNMMDYESGDYTIGEAYLDRVEEIINYALNEDMYVIINDHWDGSWWGKFGSETEATREEAMEQYVSMWTQIAERYKNYSDYLIFESANEELGSRLNDIDVCEDSGALSEDECYEMTNKINQTFVDTIRSTGGNNANRFLLIAGYNTDIEMTCDERFEMPEDTAKDKLLVSVHFYTPWGYCGTTSITSWGSKKNYEEQNSLMEELSKFTEEGYGVVIGEYAAMLNKDGTIKDNYCDFAGNLLYNCDLYGYCPMLWDCSNLFDRTEGKFLYDDVAELYQERSLAAQSDLTEEEIKENAQNALEEAYAASVDKLEVDTTVDDDSATAWIMYNSGDWGITYSVGDEYDPASKTDGVVATDAEITGAGTYTVSLDFTGTDGGYAVGTAFSALGIANGELLYPGYIITITDVEINGESYTLNGKPYTTSDDEKCTRVNLYNEWVKEIPEEARTADGSLMGASATLLNPDDLEKVETISVTFDYAPAE